MSGARKSAEGRPSISWWRPSRLRFLAGIESKATKHCPPRQTKIDHRRVFLACAAARFDLVEAGVIDIDEALSRDFVERFREIGKLTCHCEREIVENMDRAHRELQFRGRR